MSAPSQELVEALYSQRNILTILHESIKEQLDKGLLTWALGAYLRIDEYLEGSYYASKEMRLRTLRTYLRKQGLETLIVAALASTMRSRRDQTIQQCIGYIQSFMPHDDHFDRARTAGEILSLCCSGSSTSLIQIIRPNALEAPQVHVNYWPFLERLFGDKFQWIDNTMFNPPLVRQPRKINTNKSCGYHTLHESLLLGKLTQHEETQNYKAINILNTVEWVIDPYVIAEQEFSPAPLLTAQDHDNFREHLRQAQIIYDLLGTGRFWFAWQFDSRGRMYSHGYHVNFQSHEYKKAILSFNKYESFR